MNLKKILTFAGVGLVLFFLIAEPLRNDLYEWRLDQYADVGFDS